MKFLALFAAIAAVAVGAPTVSQWSLGELSAAIQDPSTSPAILPYLEEALNEMMANIFAGQQQESIAVSMPVMDVSTWTLEELSNALQDPSTDPALVPYLEHALNTYMDALFAGEQLESITIVTPAGVLPAPIVPGPAIIPEPAVIPEPEPAVVPSAPAASPLVQIIVNVNQPAAESAPIPAPAITPEEPLPVQVVEGPAEGSFVERPQPVIVVEQPETAPAIMPPGPILVVEPEPVQVVEPVAPNPIDVIAIGAPEVSPIDVIAVGAPEVNPVDIINPVIISPSPAGADIVGPIV